MDKPSTSAAADDERRKSVRFQAKKEESEAESSSENEEGSGEESDEDSEEESSSDESVELPPPLAPNRSRRLNAGNRYSKVLAEEGHKAEGDEVYETLYGGFKEVENDDNFEADSDDESDEENKDLDEEEERGEEAETEEHQGDNDEDLMEPKKKKKKVAIQKKPSWLMAQMSEDSVPLNALSTADQARRLKECKAIAEENRRSLEEMLKKQREEKEKQKIKPRARYLQGPKESYYSDSSKTYLLKPSIKQWKEAQVYERKCVVTGKPAKYRDPQTGHYYYGLNEFKEIRNNPQKYPILKKTPTAGSQVIDNPPATKQLSYPSSWNPPELVKEGEDQISIESAAANTLIWMHSKSNDQSASPPSTKELEMVRALFDDRPKRLELAIEEKKPSPMIIPQPSPSVRRPVYILKPRGLDGNDISAPQRISPRAMKRPIFISPSGPEAKIQKLG
ncbi:unnamed protein product [Bursaphelenchus xylophilus]|uniref:Vacuolar protein sorting-associated protein 72 homolog n=1 Tax=Bursaphelenchus xylophilus TaxID=6326 RepID=A0A1I7SUS6_BURXY|nr:unnamed protein product [Bursaphelenchus xylophilus]CAG9125901.1 unnamed protein product [Bursaphelenchus xylophilus]